MDSLIRGRVWPDGEFCLWRRSPADDYDPDIVSPFGLSRVANSHRAALKEAPRVQRGLKGITRYGQKMVRNGAYLLQKVHGPRRLSFLTCTIPGSPEMTMEAAEKWASIVRVFYQALARELVSNGLSQQIIGVTEIQPKRFLRTGGMPLHLHAVFQGAPKDHMWVITPQRFTEMWRSAVCSQCPGMEGESFASATNVQQVRDNAAGYLGKYMSKGESQIVELLEAAPHLASCLPHTWYNMTISARDLVKENMSEGRATGELLEKFCSTDEGRSRVFKFSKKVELKGLDGGIQKSFWVGELYPHCKRMFGIPVGVTQVKGL